MKLYYTTLLIWLIYLTTSFSLQAQHLIATVDGTDYHLNQTHIKGCGGVAVAFRLSEENGLISVNWNFGNGNTSSQVRPFEQFNTIGVFTVKAIAEYDNGNSVALEGTVEVFDATPPSIEVVPEGGCAGTTFSISNTDPTLEDVIYIVDNTLIRGDAIDVTLNNPGSYDIRLLAINANGCEVSALLSNGITVVEPFEVTLSPSISIGCSITQEVTFTADITTQSGFPLSAVVYEWNFGDGNTVTTEVPQVSHTYANSQQEYLATVTVNSYGCRQVSGSSSVAFANIQEDITISFPETSYCDPYRLVSFTPDFPSSMDGLLVQWEFEDGTLLESTLPEGVQHTLTNNSNQTITQNIQVTIGEVALCQETYSFEVTPTQQVTINAVTSYCDSPYTPIIELEDDSQLGNYYWRIQGDDNLQFPNTMTPSFGAFTGNTTIELVEEKEGTICILEEVSLRYAPLSVEITGGTLGCAPFDATLTASINNLPSGSTITSHEWILEDITEQQVGATGRATYPTTSQNGNTFSLENLPWGDYRVSTQIQIQNPDGPQTCIGTAETLVQVRLLPTLSFTPSGNDLCLGNAIQLENTSTFSDPNYPDSYANEVVYQWDYESDNIFVPAENDRGDGAHTYQGCTLNMLQFPTLSAYYPNYACSVQEQLPIETTLCLLPCQEEALANDPSLDTCDLITPSALFTVTTTPCPLGLTISNQSIGDVFTWEVTAKGNSTTFGPNASPLFPEDSLTLFLEPYGGLQSGDNISITLISGTLQSTCTESNSITVQMPDTLPTPMVSFPEILCTGEEDSVIVDSEDVQQYNWTLTDSLGATVITSATNTGTLPLSITQPGSYQGQVTLDYANGCTQTLSFGPIEVKGIFFDLNRSTATTCTDTEVNFFVDSTSFSSSSDSLQWTWIIDEDTIATGQNSTGEITPFSYSFTTPKAPQRARYKVKLQVTTENGCAHEDSVTINVSRPSITLDDLPVEYIYSCDTTYISVSPSFTADEVLNRPAPSFTWYWVDTLSNQTTLLLQEEKDLYAALPSGRNVIRLFVTDANSCMDSADLAIDIPEQQYPVAAFSASDTVLSCPGIITFSDAIDGTIGNSTPRQYYDQAGDSMQANYPVEWIWDFGDGTVRSSITGSISHYFSPPEGDGYYVSMSLKEILPTGEICITPSDTLFIRVGGVAGAYELDRRIGYEGTAVYMTALPEKDPEETYYLWASGDGQAGQVDTIRNRLHFRNQTFQYEAVKTAPGHTPSLTFYDEEGCPYPAAYSGDINILSCPTLLFKDSAHCLTQGDLSISFDENIQADALIPGEEVLVYTIDDEFGKAAYYATLQYAWILSDGSLLQGQNELTFSAGPNENILNIDPDGPGKTIGIKTWIEARYVDLENPAKNITETVCEEELSFHLSLFPSPDISIEHGTICEGQSVVFNALLDYSPFTGEQVQETLILWDIDGDGQFDDGTGEQLEYTFENSGMDSLQVLVSTENHCDITFTHYFQVNPMPVPEITVDPVCLGEPSVFTITGEVSETRWRFHNEGNPSQWHLTTTNTTAYYTYQKSGVQTVTVAYTLPSGCEDSLTLQTEVLPLPSYTLSNDIYICEGATATLSIESSSTHQWSTGSTANSITVAPSVDTTYYVEISENHNSGIRCATLDSIKVYVIPTPPIASQYESCDGEAILVDGRITDYDSLQQVYQWKNEEGNILSQEATFSIEKEGVYTLESIVEHLNGTRCTYIQTFDAIFHPNPPKVLQKQTFCFEFGDVLTLSGPEGSQYLYTWGDVSTEPTLEVYAEGSYTLTTTDTTYSTWCTTTEEVYITDLCPPRVFAPNAFTPNQDGLNDEFYIKGANINTIELLIYNRWGEVIFSNTYDNIQEAQQPGNGWNGMYKGKDMPAGAYNYVIRYISDLEPDKGKKAEYGSVTLIR
ncbi:PKD domain-containing protein [Algivirga pacifica]|uniref:PKD domain-containing protein n=1 Tax=Algivirga pacifica TaxID=1162670 RepID=A0ABP9D4D4_9BACT